MTKPNVEANSVDLADFDTGAASDAGTEIELQHPTTKKGLGVFFSVLGKDSQVFRDHVKERANARIRREALASRRGKPLDPPTADEADANAVELLTLCTTSWRSETKNDKGEVVSQEPTITLRGEKLAFNVANVQRVYTEQLWIRRQIDEAIGDMENFIKS